MNQQNPPHLDTTYHGVVKPTVDLDENAANFQRYLEFTYKALKGTALLFVFLAGMFVIGFSLNKNGLLLTLFNYSLGMVMLAYIGSVLIRSQIETYHFIYKIHHRVNLIHAELQQIQELEVIKSSLEKLVEASKKK